MSLSSRELAVFLVILLLAVAARGAAVSVWQESLTDDRDSYLALARGLAEGRGYVRPGTDEPTAYRPPVFPLVLAPLLSVFNSGLSVALLHVLLGTATVALAWRIAYGLGLGRFSVWAAALTAVDPLLVRYTAWPMTETLATALVTLGAWLLVVGWTRSGRWRLATGLIFALAVLCRPSLWAVVLAPFGGWLLWSIWNGLRETPASSPRPIQASRLRTWAALRQAVPALLAIVLLVGAWTIRNARALGHPVATTTHGGYTLLLGNNPVFYENVVEHQWGAVWTGPTFERWSDELQSAAKGAAADTSEVAFDRFCYQRAVHWIRTHPSEFTRACLFRLARFWNPTPLGPAAVGPPFLQAIVAVYFLILISSGFVGLVAGWCRGDRRWGLLMLMVLGLSAVHMVYWSNTRFRAPVTPLLAVGAASAVRGTGQRIRDTQ